MTDELDEKSTFTLDDFLTAVGEGSFYSDYDASARLLGVARREVENLRRELNLMKTSGIIEVAVRNPSVAEYMEHWEGRAEKAEAALSAAKSEPVAVLHSDIIRELQLLMESFCAYGGDAVPPSVVERARALHARLSALASEPAKDGQRYVVLVASDSNGATVCYAVLTENDYNAWNSSQQWADIPDQFGLFYPDEKHEARDKVTKWERWAGVMQYVTESGGEIVDVFPCMAY